MSPADSMIPTLSNVDDTDLLENPPIQNSIEVATISSFQVIRARVRNTISDFQGPSLILFQITTEDLSARLTGSDAKIHKYEDVLAFDGRTRVLLDQLPAYFKCVQPKVC